MSRRDVKVFVAIESLQERGKVMASVTNVCSESFYMLLTPTQARELSHELMEAARRADDISRRDTEAALEAQIAAEIAKKEQARG